MPAIIEQIMRRDRASWWRSPQQLWLRRAIFQIHLWLGLILTLYAIVIGVSGSVLVFREEIEEALRGQSLHVPSQTGPANFEASVRAIEAAQLGYVGVSLEDFERRDQMATLLVCPKLGAPKADYRLISFDPYTGRVAMDRERYAGLLGWMTNLHYYLLSGQTGLRVSGFMAGGVLILCISGLVLWWPGVRRWAAGLTLHRRARWQRFNWDLHSVVGFWSSAILVLFSFTGLYFAFPEPVAKITVWASGGGSTKPLIHTFPQSLNQNQAPRAKLTIDQALSAIAAALPPDAPAGYLQLPSTPDAPYRATGYYKNTAPFSQLVQVVVDSHSGAKLSSNDTREASRGMQIIQYFFAVHFGSFGGKGVVGIGVKALWVLLGMAAPLLAVTGLLMYWNRKLRPLLKTLRAQ